MEDKNELNSHEITQMNLAYKRTDLSIIRTELAISNTKLSVEQTHLSFLRTIVSLIGSAATIYKALPALGVSNIFSSVLAIFLVLAAVYFIIRDRLTYPRLKAKIKDIEEQKERLVLERRYSEEADD
ncbi:MULTISPECIES: DUF202 domain-containing protein [Eubacterium]|uniref:DUF202 domain-containing protein n=1 Tax=Eubacterium ruminantium TaxID=42322 RepID=A0A1T4K4Z9_9FIRM|nr:MULTISPECIES: DUF202 domain-containing protein [Eubacterium]MCR5367203.1 DUF202 domain-containing protein [Eubacterium sp.]SCW27735.1 hypothetical protein SAMN05660484_00173 [Eubacterium ruminantium]SDM13898.1 hypothetical protein SAMN04490370_101170 [Eubacterium ruminantium]SJZ37407.1 hypothetical protein SAMN02745110_00157 [Eubacterium ruminantium]